MDTVLAAVKEMRRGHPIAIVSPKDFELAEPTAIEPERILKDPSFSLYCFDWEAQQALFVRVDDPAAIDAAPFYYQAQSANAVAVATMPLATFHDLASRIPEPPNGIALIHSVGRCGSTLMSKLLETVPGIYSLSEPDDLTQLALLRSTGTMADGPVAQALQSSIRWRCKPRASGPASLVAVKTRAEVLSLADLIGPCFSNARHLFLYRDGISWMRTIFRTWPVGQDVYAEEQNREIQAGWAETLPVLRSMPPLNAVEIRMMGWVVAMEGYLSLLGFGVKACALRYEDLIACPRDVFGKVLSFCDLQMDNWAAVDEVLGRDSQAGTIFGREERRHMTNQLTPELEEVVRRFVAGRPLLRTPHVILPKTIACGNSGQDS